MHPKQRALENKLYEMSMDLDHHLEDTFGSKFPLHPNRLERGMASSPNYDGLFSTGVQFTPGYGSKYGRGYLLDIDIRTLSFVKKEQKTKIEEEAIAYLEKIMPTYFPTRNLKIKRDGVLIKIIGDFSLGSA